MRSFFVACLLYCLPVMADQVYVNKILQKSDLLQKNEVAIDELTASLLIKGKNPEKFECVHKIKQIQQEERLIILEDESVFKVSYWDRNDFQDWLIGDLVKITSSIKIKNVRTLTSVNASFEKLPAKSFRDYIARTTNATLDPSEAVTLTLQNGAIFKGLSAHWKVKETIFVFSTDQESEYQLWNIDRNEQTSWVLIGNEQESISPSIIHFEERLNRKVLGQSEAISAVKDAIFNYYLGLNNPNMPIGVFLFLGPTGVGKTELAKVLAEELFKNQTYLIRFDMSHFSEPHSLARLIGSPPGYVNHEEGGQLTQALKAKPKSIVLLDEMEKAHPFVRKIFLPVFDEGYIKDSKDKKICCKKVLFIMTSNICASEICQLYSQKKTTDQVLHAIEPYLIQELSPELYNRVVPVLFRPLGRDLMESLVNLMLKEVTLRLKQVKNIDLVVDDTAKNYLIVNGFHPTLGARPLKKLIQKKIISNVAQAIVLNSIPDGTRITISYIEKGDTWNISWQ